MAAVSSPADLGTDHVIVNRTLAQIGLRRRESAGPPHQVCRPKPRSDEDDDNPTGWYIRAALQLERWYEIVGVVPDFPANELEPRRARLSAAAFGDIYPARIGVRVRAADPAAFSGALRDVSVAVNPNLQVRDIARPRSW